MILMELKQEIKNNMKQIANGTKNVEEAATDIFESTVYNVEDYVRNVAYKFDTHMLQELTNNFNPHNDTLNYWEEGGRNRLVDNMPTKYDSYNNEHYLYITAEAVYNQLLSQLESNVANLEELLKKLSKKECIKEYNEDYAHEYGSIKEVVGHIKKAIATTTNAYKQAKKHADKVLNV